MITSTCRIVTNFFIVYYSLIKRIYSLLPIICNISIPDWGPHSTHNNCVLECKSNVKPRILDDARAYGTPVSLMRRSSALSRHEP